MEIKVDIGQAQLFFENLTEEQLSKLKGGKGDKGEQGEIGKSLLSIKSANSVSELPTTENEGILYIVPNGSSETDNVCDEYFWVNGKYEKFGSLTADISSKADKSELLNYVLKTDTVKDEKVSVSTDNYGTGLTQDTFNSYLSRDMNTVKTSISTNEEAIKTSDDKISTANDRITTLDNKLTQSYYDKTTAHDEFYNKSGVDGLISGVNSTINGVKGSVSGVQGQVTGVSQGLSGVGSQVTSLTDRVKALEDDITSATKIINGA